MTAHPETKCASKLPQDLCCLYGIGGQECDRHFHDWPPPDLDGYLVVASAGDTEKMATFLRRVVEDGGDKVVQEEDFRKLAYSAWAMQPPVQPSQVPWKEQLQESWKAVQAKLDTDPSVEKNTKTRTTTTASVTTTTPTTTRSTTTLTATTSTFTTTSATHTTSTGTGSTVTTSTTTTTAAAPINFVKVFGIVVLLAAAIGGFLVLAYQQFCRQPPAAAVPQARESRPIEAELSRM